MHGVASFWFRGGLGMIYSRNSRVLGDVCSPALGLLVLECNVALYPCEQCCARDYPTAQRLSFIMHPCMHLCLCVYMRLCMCLHVHRGPCPQDFFGYTSLRLQSEVKFILAIILHLSPVIMQYQRYASIHACVCVSVCACMHMCMCLHVSVHNIMCSAGPEVAVLDCYGPEAYPVYC